LAPPGCIGFHFHEQSWTAAGDETLFLEYRDYQQCLIPITYYNNDFRLLGWLHQRIPFRLTLLPRLAARAVLREISRMRALVCSSLHAAIFAYSQNVPFLVFGQPSKLVEFMEDRGLERWVFRDGKELRTKLAALLHRAPDYTVALQRDWKRLDEHFARLASCLPRVSRLAPAHVAQTPGIEHKLLIEHQHRIDALERMADRLCACDERLSRELSRQENQITQLREALEASERAPAKAAPRTRADDHDLPFGYVESPASSTVVTDRCEISGWALSASGVSEVRVYVDGRLAASAGVRDYRPDVARAYPGFPDNPFAGWTITLDMAPLPEGLHELLLQARSRTGSSRDLGVLSIVKVGCQEKGAVTVASEGEPGSAERQNQDEGKQRSQSLSQSLEGLLGRVVGLERAHAQFQSRLEGLAQEVSDLGCSLDAVPVTLEVVRDDLSGLKHAVATLQARAAATQDETRAVCGRLSALSAEMSVLSGRVSGVSENVGRYELTARRTLDDIASAFQRLSERLAALESQLQSNAERLQAIYASRIWRTLKMLAAPFDRLIRLTHTLSSRGGDALARPAFSPSVDEQSQEKTLGAPDAALQVGIDSEIPNAIPVGEGNVLVVSGWCYHPNQRVRKLEIAIGGTRHCIKLRGLPRPDVYSAHFPSLDSKGYSLYSGFWSLVTVQKCPSRKTVDLVLHATLRDGRRSEVKLASTTLTPTLESSGSPVRIERSDRSRPLVAICLTTYNPPLDLFTRQIESLIGQSYCNWVCIISDDCSSPEIYEQICAIVQRDPRFHVRRSPRHLGFYANFEHCLSLVPPEADFVALCDQDDCWHPDKLESLLAVFRPDTTLAYSDMNITDEAGRVISSTYWFRRRNNYRSLASLLLANTVTGAASMFRRSLLKTLLPFPRTPGAPYHDHWIACVALATGEIAYVNRPLYDYVQHSGNVIGHFAPQVPSWFQNLRALFRNSAALKHALSYWRSIYFGDVLRVEILASVIQLRAAGQLSWRKRLTLRRVELLDASLTGAIWLALRPLRRLWRGNETLGAETRLLRGVLWRHLAVVHAALAGRGNPPSAASTATPQSVPNRVAQQALANVELIRQKIAPLRLQISASAPQRVNFLIPTIDFTYLFGGYIAKLNLARKLAQMGFSVRILIVDYCDFRPDRWASQLREFDGLEKVLDSCELVYAFDRSRCVPVNPHDTFVATTWWTAYIARDAARQLAKEAFLYLIQEYEPLTFPMGSFAAMAAETYNWAHYALFSTDFLREYFRQESLGVYRWRAADADLRAATFNNAITSVVPVTRQELACRRTRKLLFYARPEGHAARNMFELGVLALSAVIEEGGLPEPWEFTGVGAVSSAGRIALPGQRYLRLLQRRSQAEYRQLLAEHDLGLSLMYTPHVSLVPIEMAAAGMVVVTNTFGSKTAERLEAISRNIIAVQPSLEALAAGLRAAVARVEDFEARALGCRVDWPRNWEEALNSEVMERVSGFLRELAG
jgi:glycosyltransferase involved in cell wall biosynthesis/predicted  nucleic acid-binding Zn-ribbon protein